MKLLLKPLGWLLVRHRTLSRFAGYRRGVALAASYPIAALAALVIEPLTQTALWPLVAQDALAGIVGGVWRLALGGWLTLFVAATDWLPASRLQRHGRLAGTILVASALSAGVGDLGEGLRLLAELPRPGARCVTATALWSTAPPLAIGLAPVVGVAVAEWLGAVPAMRRLFHTGMAPGGGWMGRRAMKKHVRPLPKNQP